MSEMSVGRPSRSWQVCIPDAEGHCVTCADEALPARVVRVDDAGGIALVALGDSQTEVDVSLLDDVRCDQLLLVHAGVAIARLEEQDV